jgi:putative transposase
VLVVDPRNTSRTCPACGHVSAENRKTQAVFRCVRCGHAADADVNAARNILAAGHAVIACGERVQQGPSMKQEPAVSEAAA